MNVSGIRPYAGFYDYNSINTNELRSRQLSQAKDEALEVQNNPATLDNPVAEAAPKQDFTSFDYSKKYEPNKNYDLKGVDSDIYNLDTQKAISDLDKDQVLKQYQYFVGDKNQAVVNKAMNPAEKIYRSGENFSL